MKLLLQMVDENLFQAGQAEQVVDVPDTFQNWKSSSLFVQNSEPELT